MPLMTRRSSTRALPRVSVGRLGGIVLTLSSFPALAQCAWASSARALLSHPKRASVARPLMLTIRLKAR